MPAYEDMYLLAPKLNWTSSWLSAWRDERFQAYLNGTHNDDDITILQEVLPDPVDPVNYELQVATMSFDTGPDTGTFSRTTRVYIGPPE